MIHKITRHFPTRYLFLFYSLISAMTVIAKKSDPPNVVVIYTDDHRYTGIHALGGQLETPSMDLLAEEGLVFTNTYLMGSFSGATCIPSRSMLQTGRQLFNLQGIGWTIPQNYTTMGEAFKAAGYHAHHVGKWHQDYETLSRSFDSGGRVMGLGAYLGDQFRMPLWDWNNTGEYPTENSYLLEWNDKGKAIRKPFSKSFAKGPFGTEATGPHTSEVFADDAEDFIRGYKSKKKPFFLYLAFHAPHDPRQAPKSFKKMYPEEEISLPPSYMPQHPFDKADITCRDEKLAVWPRTPAVSQKELSDYHAIITHMDVQIGRVIQALKESGQYENTIIVLAGDSGLAVGNHGLMGKQNLYSEDGIHVPFIISGGKINGQGRRIDALSYIHDIFPTLCDVAGIDKPASIDGKSLAPVINGEQEQVRDYTYHAYKQYERAYRKGDFKLIEFVRAKDANRQKEEFIAGSRVTLLFNIKEDPWEITDLSFRSEYKDLVVSMRKEMKEKAIELHDDPKRLNYSFDFWDYFTE